MRIEKSNQQRGTSGAKCGAAPADYGTLMLFEAVVTAGAVVAAADGWVDPAERSELVAYVQRSAVFSNDASAYVNHAVDVRLRQFEQPGGMTAAIGSLQRIGGSREARALVTGAADCVAAADGCVEICETRAVQLVCTTLSPPSRRAASRHAVRFT